MTDGRILWANLLYLFVLSFQPVTTGWVGRSNFATLPVRVYVLVALACSGRYVLLEKAVSVLMIAKNTGEVGRILIAHQGPMSPTRSFGSVKRGFASRMRILFSASWKVPSVSLLRSFERCHCLPILALGCAVWYRPCTKDPFSDHTSKEHPVKKQALIRGRSAAAAL